MPIELLSRGITHSHFKSERLRLVHNCLLRNVCHQQTGDSLAMPIWFNSDIGDVCFIKSKHQTGITHNLFTVFGNNVITLTTTR